MADTKTVSSKLRAYLAELSPAARAMLMVGLDRARADGAADPIHDYIANALRDVVADNDETVQRVADPSRLFFAAIEDFLIDDVLPTKLTGRIARGSLDRIWTWLADHVAVDDIRALKAAITAARPVSDLDEDFEDTATHFRTAVMRQVSSWLAQAATSPESRRRIAGYIGGDRNFEELEDIHAIMALRPQIVTIAALLPERIDTNDPEHVAAIAAAMARAGADGGRLASYAAILVHGRVDVVARLPRIVAAALGTEDTRLIVAAPIGRIIDVVLSDIEWAQQKVLAALNSTEIGLSAAQPLREYNILSRQLRASIGLDSQPSDWSRRLMDIRTKISARLATEIAELPPLLRRCARPLRAFSSRVPTPPDEIDVDRARMLIEVFDVARLASAELALNELVTRTRNDIEAYVESATTSLTDDLRADQLPERREIAIAHAAAAVRLHEALFGAARAALVRRSFENAAGGSVPALRAAAS